MGFTLNNIYTGMSIPQDLVLRIQDIAHIPYFIETGTAGGESVKWASGYFEECWTIEADQTREIDKSAENVHYHAGNSEEVLPSILLEDKLKDKNTPIFFWLDAHWCEPYQNNTGRKECYLIEEIEALRDRPNVVVLVDDARLFAGPPPYPNDPRDWPRLDTIFFKLHECLPSHMITVVDDYIVAVPQSLVPVIDQEWVDNYKLRYRSEDQLLWESVNITHKAFLNYITTKPEK